jgi:phage terminase large subunit-like protein
MSKTRSSKRDRVLVASQTNSRSLLTPKEYQEQLKRPVQRLMNVDPLSAQQSIVQNRIRELKQDLPHLHGWPFYKWTREFFESRNKINLLCAANQIGKSSCAIRKTIEWACNKKLWPELWGTEPKIFWYFYPSEGVAATEFEKKWVPEFLPRGAMKNDANYGWDVEYNNGTLEALHFKSGVTVYFKSYGQKIVNLQTATLHYMVCDEELPEEYVDELLARLRSTGGYFHQVFTATRGLQLWYRAMECIGTEDEAFKSAYKRTVSMYECQFYEDGTPSKWTPERIAEAEAQCTSKKEVLKRIHGRFVKDDGLRYEPFDTDRNVKEATFVPSNWRYYSAVDIGSGGKGRSAGAIVFVAVNPEFTQGRVVRTWRGDHEETTAADILNKYREVRGSTYVTQAGYDYASREFGLIAARSGEGFIRADKTKNSGEATLNTLFKSGALTIDAGVTHNQKLITELMSVPGGVQKNRSFQDDLTDALRYACALIPWDFAKISPGDAPDMEETRDEIPEAQWTAAEYLAWEIRQRRGEMDPSTQKAGWKDFEDEVQEWNEMYGS